ncbi:MAG: EAL domain-containing protein [Burkholderiaceae bacterium]
MGWMTGDAGSLSARFAFVVFVAALATFVALDSVQRAQGDRRRVGLRWIVGVALSLGTGIWSAHLIGLSAIAAPAGLAYRPMGIFGAWAWATVSSMACLGWMVRRDITLARVVLAGNGLGVAIVGTPMLALWSMALRPVITWDALALALALVAAALTATLALMLFFQLRIPRSIRLLYRQLGAGALVGLGLAASAWLVIAAAGIAPDSVASGASQLTTGAMALLAAVGSITMLSALTLASMAEGRSRAAAQRAKAEMLQKHAVRDPLTDLPNRVMFETTLAQAVQKADATQTRLALLFINLDGFKPINESFGHRGGDRILREMAKRLRTLARPHALARLGGDEFLLLLPDDPSHDDVARQASEVLEAVAQPCRAAGPETTLSCSIGIASYPEHGALSRLIAHADAAMRSAKGMGGATYCHFEAHMRNGGEVKQNELLRDLRLALGNGELQLYYQPKIHAPSGEITAAEALLRWHHPKRGVISPAIFIPIAERFGLIAAIGEWVIDAACRQARIWRDEGLRMRVAINLSVHQLRKADLAERIAAALEQHQINPQLLTCEITESDAMDDTERTMKIFNALNAMGVHLSIDDFGTGYSSLSTLRKMRPGELKIDRSFVLDLESSADARAVVDAVVKLAKALDIKVVAEGVETEAQHQILRSLGCDELQGFLFAKPMSASALGVWAMSDVGPRTLAFRTSLFKETRQTALH